MKFMLWTKYANIFFSQSLAKYMALCVYKETSINDFLMGCVEEKWNFRIFIIYHVVEEYHTQRSGVTRWATGT